MSICRIRRAGLGALTLLTSTLAFAAAPRVPVHTLNTDLRPLIRAAIQSPAQFAVPVPHAASTASAGTWSVSGGRAVWRYAVRVPTAVSLSFHATEVTFPESAVLEVRGARTTTSYSAREVHRAQIWSRVQPGSALEFTLTVAASERSKLRFGIVSLQAGYRSLGAGVADHPYFRQLKQHPLTGGNNSSCAVNYACRSTAANAPAGAATVALLIENQFQCSGTLVNDVPGDNTPYILSARHCISGKVGVADDPSAAAGTSVFWDATSSCGSALGSIYDPGVPTQTGAQTIVEQQDAWLIRLDVNPVVADAQFAGFDASGAAVQGGYTVHQAEGSDKQYVAWVGQALPENRFSGFSPFLETLNQDGNIGPGASGSGLFNQNNRLVGSLTYGRDTSDPSGYGSCPPPGVSGPNGSNGAGDFTALAAVWNSTADATSSTGSATLKAALDPLNTGTLLTTSAPAAVIVLNASAQTAIYGTPLQLTWSASGATQCTATGGVSGDGWSGTLATTGSQSVTENLPGGVSYSINCAYPGGRTAKTLTTVAWVGPYPQLTLTPSATILWTGRPEVLTWSSNITPCALSGGAVALTHLPASGSTTTTQTTAGEITYNLSCGPDIQDSAEVDTLVQYATPSLVLQANGTDRRLGEPLVLQWLSYADTCTPSGGAPNDGWTSNSFRGQDFFSPTVTAEGSYTYTLVCASGDQSVQQSVAITVESGPPFASAALQKDSVRFSASPADYVGYSWNSNLTQCYADSNSLLQSIEEGPLAYNISPQGRVALAAPHSGTYTVQENCTSQDGATRVSSAPMTLTVLPPPAPVVTITFTPSHVVSGEAFTVAWSASDAANCQGSDGIPGDTWMYLNGVVSGSMLDQGPLGGGTYTFTMTCQSIDSMLPATVVHQSLTVQPLSATLNSTATSVTTGQSFTLTWSSDASECTATGGGADGTQWTGTLPPSGSVTQTASAPGTFDYRLICVLGNQQGYATDVTIKVTAATSSSGGGGGGGGGALEALELLALAGLLRRRRAGSLQCRSDRHS